MISIAFIILLTLLALYKDKFIRKHNVKLYIAATILAILTFVLRYKVPITEPFTQGYLGFSFLYLVMMAGALKKKSKLQVKLFSVRREYSIIGFIFISPHGFKYLLEFLNGARSFEWFGVLPYLIMVPLFITSFMIVRKKFTFQTWKKIQRFAYIVYILILVHLILVASETLPLIMYIVLFIIYTVLKLKKEYLIYNNNKKKNTI